MGEEGREVTYRSEVYCAVAQGRRGIGIELKPSYYRQAVQNIEQAGTESDQATLNLEPEAATE